MKLLIAGVLIFSLLHLLPAGGVQLRERLISGMGENAYKGVFALLMIASIVSMVMGWKSTEAEAVYTAPDWGGLVTSAFLLGTSIMFFTPYMPNNISRFVRHPQLMGIVLFGIGHLAGTGNVRDIVLFGIFAAWAAVEILLLVRRDGAWEKPEAVPFKSDLKLLLAGLGFFLIFLFTHDGLFGTTLLTQ